MAIQLTPSVALRAPPPPDGEELQQLSCSPKGELRPKVGEGVNGGSGESP